MGRSFALTGTGPWSEVDQVGVCGRTGRWTLCPCSLRSNVCRVGNLFHREGRPSSRLLREKIPEPVHQSGLYFPRGTSVVVSTLVLFVLSSTPLWEPHTRLTPELRVPRRSRVSFPGRRSSRRGRPWQGEDVAWTTKKEKGRAGSKEKWEGRK